MELKPNLKILVKVNPLFYRDDTPTGLKLNLKILVKVNPLFYRDDTPTGFSDGD